MFKLRPLFSRRGLLLFLWLTLVVAPLAIVLHVVIEPQPRWSVQAPQVQLVSLSVDGSRLVTFRSQEGLMPLAVWDTGTGKKVATFLSSAGELPVHIPDAPDRYFAAPLTRGEHIVLVDLKQGCEKTLAIKATPIAFSPAERFLVVEDRTITGDRRLVDTATGKVVEGLTWQEWYSFSPDDERLFYSKTIKTKDGDEEHCIHMWDCRRGTEKAWPGIRQPMTAAPDGRTFLAAKFDYPESGGFTITQVLWDSQTGKARLLETIGVGTYDTNDARFSPDSSVVVLEDKDGLKFWDVATAKLLSKVKLANGFVNGQFSPDGRKYVAFDNATNSLIAWCPQNGERVWTKTWPQELDGLIFRFHDDGRALLVKEDMAYHSLDANTGQLRFIMSAGEINPFVNALPFIFPRHSRNQRHMITYEAVFGDPWQETSLWDKLCFWKSRPAFVPPAFVPMAAFGILSHRLKVIETNTGRQIAELPFDLIPDGLVSEDGKILITLAGDALGGNGAVMTCWDLPQRPPWLWVYGPPAAALALGLVVFSVGVFRARRASEGSGPTLANASGSEGLCANSASHHSTAAHRGRGGTAGH